MIHEVGGGGEGGGGVTFRNKRNAHKHACTSSTGGVLHEDDLQSIFKYFAMETGSMIRGK